MSREILFKAKRADNGEWVEGYYAQLPKPNLGATILAGGELCAEDVADYIIVNKPKQHSNFSHAYPIEIVEYEQYEVDSETICQYTGLTDENGKKIWENDVVTDGEQNYYKAFWQEKYYQFSFVCIKTENIFFEKAKWDLRSLAKVAELEICGNIFDNPELLEK